jgi:hypothetical protein
MMEVSPGFTHPDPQLPGHDTFLRRIILPVMPPCTDAAAPDRVLHLADCWFSFAGKICRKRFYMFFLRIFS